MMVLKQCHPRLSVFLLNHHNRPYDTALNKDTFHSSTRPSNLPLDSSTLSVVSRRSNRTEGRTPGTAVVRLRTVRRIHARELSTSTNNPQYDVKPEIPRAPGRQLYFDTHAVVRLLEDNGFTTEQAEVLVNVLMKMTHSNMNTIYGDMVTKSEQEIMLQRVMSQIAAVKKDMIILEKSEFSTLLAENEKLKIQLLQLKVQLVDIMNKLRSDSILDMSLEKSRVNELKTENEKRLLEMRTEVMEMTAEQDRHLTQSNMKIDTEVAGLKTMLESHKLDTIKYLAGSVFTCLTVVLGFYRIWM